MHLFGCLIGLLLLSVVLIMLAPMILLQIARSFFGTKAKQFKKQNQQQETQQQQTSQQKKSKPNSRQRRSKIFEQHEGEYVEFTEVKD